MNAIKLCAAIGVAGLLAACAQQEEPTMVAPQPVYDKFGGGSCEGDYIYIPGAPPQIDQCIPDDECEPYYNTATQQTECLPPNRYPDPNDGEDDPRGRTDPNGSPFGSPTAGPIN